MLTSRRLRSSFDVGADGLHDALAAGGVGVADVELEDDAAGDGVDGAGMDVAGADGGYGVDGAGGEGVAFDGENELGGGAEGVAAVGHQECSGVASEACDGEAVARGGGDAGDDAEGDAVRARGVGLARCGVRSRRGSGWVGGRWRRVGP